MLRTGKTSFRRWMRLSFDMSSGSMNGCSSKPSRSSTLKMSAPNWKKHTVEEGNSLCTTTSS